MGFADVIKLRNLKWGDYPALSGCTLNAITSVYKREAEGDLADREVEEMIQ